MRATRKELVLARLVGLLARHLMATDPNAVAVFRRACADAREGRAE